MKLKRALAGLAAVMFLLAGMTVWAANEPAPKTKEAETAPAPAVKQRTPRKKAADSASTTGALIKGTIYMSDQADWSKMQNCNCDCIEVTVSQQTGTSGGQVPVPTYTVLHSVKAKGRSKIGPNTKCIYSIGVREGNLNNLVVGAKYTGKFEPALQTGGGGIGSHPLNLNVPFSLISGGTVVFDMKMNIDYIK